MATAGFKDTISNGLVFCLDAANTKSYSGSGTSWLDLVSRVNVVLSNISFSSQNVGHLSFNGSNSIGTSGAITTSVNTNFTMDIWCRPTGTITVYNQSITGFNPPFLSNHKFVISPEYRDTNSGAGISVGTNGINVIEHGNAFFPAPLVYYATISSTSFTNITVVYISKRPYLYINGVFIKSGLITSSPITYLSLGYGIGAIPGGPSYGVFSGGVASIRCYNRSLSDAEVLQNYNSMKVRFI